MLNSTDLNSIFSSGFYMPSNWLSPLLGILGLGGLAGNNNESPGANNQGVANETTPLGQVNVAAGGAIPVGGLSVPPSWATAAQKGQQASLSSSVTTASAGETSGPAGPGGVPGMFGAPGSRASFNQPKYGKRLTIVPRPPAGG
jgi:hypothetical protein